jgi:glutathione S-transferase
MLNVLAEMMGHGGLDPAAVQQNEALLCECLDLYEKKNSKSDYFTGDVSTPSSTSLFHQTYESPAIKTFSIVDLFHAPWLQFLPHLGLGDEIESRKPVSKWWASISSRPSWNIVLGQMEYH